MRVCQNVVNVVRADGTRKTQVDDLNRARFKAENTLSCTPEIAVEVNQDINLSLFYGRSCLKIS